MDHDTFFNGKEEDSRSEPGTSDAVNVGELERFASGIAGGFFTLGALKRGGFAGMLMGLAGSSLIYRAATGQCQLYKALGINTARKADSADPSTQSASDGESSDEQMHEEAQRSHRNINMKAASAKAQQWAQGVGVD